MAYKPTRSMKEALEIANIMAGSYNYIFGYKEYMNPVTKSRVEELARQNPSTFTHAYIEKACKFIGKNAIDCSGLVCECLDISVIGSYSICDLPIHYPKIYSYVSMDERMPGDILWKKGHVGLCKDKNNIIEARSINAGVGIFQFTSQNWVKCIRPKYNDDCYEKTGWIMEPDGRMWYAKSKKKGDYYKNGFHEIDGRKYFFDEDGYLVKTFLVTTMDDGCVEYVVKRLV